MLHQADQDRIHRRSHRRASDHQRCPRLVRFGYELDGRVIPRRRSTTATYPAALGSAENSSDRRGSVGAAYKRIDAPFGNFSASILLASTAARCKPTTPRTMSGRRPRSTRSSCGATPWRPLMRTALDQRVLPRTVAQHDASRRLHHAGGRRCSPTLRSLATTAWQPSGAAAVAAPRRWLLRRGRQLGFGAAAAAAPARDQRRNRRRRLAEPAAAQWRNRRSQWHEQRCRQRGCWRLEWRQPRRLTSTSIASAMARASAREHRQSGVHRRGADLMASRSVFIRPRCRPMQVRRWKSPFGRASGTASSEGLALTLGRRALRRS